MSGNRWIVAGIAAALIAAGGVFLLIAPTKAPEDAPAVQVESETESPATSESAAIPVKADTVVEETVEAEIAPSAPAAFPSATERRERVGRGRVYGTARIPADAARGLEISIALHRVPGRANEDFTYDDTLTAEVIAGSDGTFEFKGLQLGDYVLLATATGYTINGAAALTAERPEDDVTLSLVPGGTISGRIVDPNRQPVAGARVFVGAWDIQGQQSFAPRERALASQRRSDENGNFTITNLRKSLNNDPGYRLAVKAEGFATFLSDYLQAGTQSVEFVLKPGAIVSGMLLNATTGEPVPDKTIAIESELAMENLSTKTDTEGFFFVSDLPPGMHTASLRDDELVITPESAKFQVAAEGPTEEVVLQAATGGKISGRVYNAETGQGVAGVEMFGNFVGPSDSRQKEVVTNSEGVYLFKGLKAGSYRISYRKPEGYPENYRSEETNPLVATAVGSEVKGVDFALTQGLRISGRVVDEEGKPVAQASVSANARRGNAYDHIVTKEDGAFVVAGFAVGQEVQVSVSKQGFAMLGAEPAKGLVSVGEDGTTGVRLVLGAAGSISGTVVNKSGTPMPSVQMWVRSPQQIAEGSPIEASAADGTITFDRLSPGEYTFNFDGISNGGNVPNAQRIKVGKGEKITGVKILYPELGGLSITGRVLDTKGNGIARATIRLEGPWREVNSDANGNYTVTGLNEGTHTLVAASYAHSSSVSQTAEAGATGVNFVLKDFARIEGRVVSAQTSQPITAFRVRTIGQSGQRYYVRDEFISVRDADGRFTLTNVEDGATALEVRAEDYSDTSFPLSRIVGGESRKDILVRMEAGVVVAGRVVDSTGKGVGGARIFLGKPPQEWEQDRQQRAASGSDGSFRLTSMPAGQAEISAVHTKFAPKTVTANLTPRVENTVEIVLSAGGLIEGMVTLNGKTPVSGTQIWAHFGNDNRQAQTDANGRYQLAGLPEGKVTVQASFQGELSNRSKNTQVDVKDGYISEANFDFIEGTATIEGTVYQSEGVPLTGQSYISATSLGAGGVNENYGTQLDGNGNYSLTGVAAGEVTLRVFGQQGGGKRVTVNVTAGARIRKDILLYGGGTLRADVTGGEGQTLVWLITGSVQIPELSMEVIQSFQNLTAGQAAVNNGQAVVSGLDPGPYTALVISIAPGAESSGDPLAGAKWTTQQVEIREDQEVSIQVRL